VHDLLDTPQNVNPKQAHAGGQRLTGYVGKPSLIGKVRFARDTLPVPVLSLIAC